MSDSVSYRYQLPVTVVTVTYGNRVHLLAECLQAAKRAGAMRAIVVDNGSTEDVGAALSQRFGAWLTVTRLPANFGSALGFKTGIKTAIDRGDEYICILDDDNIIVEPGIARLYEALLECSRAVPLDRTAVFGFRPTRHARLVEARCGGRPLRLRSAFRGFHVRDIPDKILSRLHKRSPSYDIDKKLFDAPWSAYGGFFFHRSLIGTIGLPREDFILYDDDTEFTHRVLAKGGKIHLVHDAVITDIEESWNTRSCNRPQIFSWVFGPDEWKVFYSLRNGTFVDFYVKEHNGLILGVNFLIWLSMLTLLCLLTLRPRRVQVLWSAVKAGLGKKLGASELFQIPGIKNAS